jgi:phosphate transport system protein
VLLAKRCPVAGDLRLVMAASKIVTHLERVGDEVAKAANVLLEQFQRDPGSMEEASRAIILEAGQRTLGLLREALGVFGSMDFAGARRLSAATDGSIGNSKTPCGR